MTVIRTITIKEAKSFYISLNDIFCFFIEHKILTKKQASKWLWQTKKKIIKIHLSKIVEGQTDNLNEPLIIGFNDYFCFYSMLYSLLPELKSENQDFNKFKRQFFFVVNCEDEYFFNEQSYNFDYSLIEKATFNFNRIRQ